MNELIVVDNVRGQRFDDDEMVWLNLEDAAKGLGFSYEKNGIIYVRWERVNSYLKEIGFSPLVAKPNLIPEWVFWRLAMKAGNAAAVAFQDKVAKEIIPKIRATGRYEVKPLSPKEMFREAIRQIELREEAERALVVVNKQYETAQKQIAHDKQWVDLGKDLTETPGSIMVSEFCKTIDMYPPPGRSWSKGKHKGVVWNVNELMGEHKVYELLRQESILQNTTGREKNYPNQAHRNTVPPRLELAKKIRSNSDGDNEAYFVPMITPSGTKWLREYLIKIGCETPSMRKEAKKAAEKVFQGTSGENGTLDLPDTAKKHNDLG
jgi:prophage antirepressor-like protein